PPEEVFRKPDAVMPSEDDQPEARKPTLGDGDRPRPKPEPTPEPEVEQAQPGDIICAVCGTPNDPTRRFCRRCGNKLVAAAAPVVAKVPWWRRIFGGGTRKTVAPAAAGTRPKSMGSAGQSGPSVIGRLIPLVLVGLVAFGATSVIVIPDVRNGIGDAIAG